MGACVNFKSWAARVVLVALLASVGVHPATCLQESGSSSSEWKGPSGTIARIEFAGLRRVRDAALRSHLTSRAGQLLDPKPIEEDVRALDRLGWFDWVHAEVELLAVQPTDEQAVAERLQLPLLRLVFRVQERPLLAGISFRGSRVLPREQIGALLTAHGIAFKVAAPVEPYKLQLAAKIIESELADRGFPRAQVNIRVEPVPTAAVRASLEIRDGPEIRVADVSFIGNHANSNEDLRHQMKRVAPHALLAGLRGKNTYTPARLEKDLRRLADYYRNHGYPEARFGTPEVRVEETIVRRWWPWPGRVTAICFHISVPVTEGTLYTLESVEIQNDLPGATPKQTDAAQAALQHLKTGEGFSQRALEQARDALARLHALRPSKKDSLAPEVEVTPQFDRARGVAQVAFHIREARPYTVRWIEFAGHRRFSDRYYRRRVLLKEGDVFNPEKLELGLTQLASTGFIRPVRPQDIHVLFDEDRRTADVAIRFEEIGRQRFSLVGGQAVATGNTLGIAYNVFDLLGGEELLTGYLEGGPESLQIAVSLAKEAVFGTRASLGLSVYRNIIRPSIPGTTGRGPLFTSRTTGLGVNWNYPLSTRDTLGAGFQLSRSVTQYSLDLPPELAGRVDPQLRVGRENRAANLNWAREENHQRIASSVSYSGGWLGGDLNLLQSSLEYTRLARDPFSHGRNAWAFRGYLAGVASHRGALPLESRLFAGDEFVRGFRPGELGPYAVIQTENAGGTATYHAQSPGANLVGGINAEYRIPLLPRTETAAFFDAGSGWLVLPWTGPGRPSLLDGTDGLLRASTGLEFRFEVPGVKQTVRIHYAYNLLRLAQAIALPDGALFRAPDRRGALGWGLGTLF